VHYFELNLLGKSGSRATSYPAAAETHADGLAKTGQLVVSRRLADTAKGTRVTVNSSLGGAKPD
jgi:hypothetical protein